MVKRRRKKWLTISAALIVFLTFLFGRVFTDGLKETIDSISTADNLYRTELRSSNLTEQLANLQFQINAEKQKMLSDSHPEGKDYSAMVAENLAALEQRRGELNVEMDKVSRFLDKLPAGAQDLRTIREDVTAHVDWANKSVDETEKPSQTNDWRRALQVKFAMLAVLLAQIHVAVLGDMVLTRANQVRDAREKLYRFFVWASYVLYALGAGLGLYAQLSGIGPISGTE